MNSSTSSNSTASSSFSQGVASDSIGSSDIIPTRKSRMGNFVDILIKLLALLVGGIQVYLFYEYACKRDGEWSNWGAWSKCNGGLVLRSRYCNSPSPSIFGQYCQGSSDQYQICNLDSCKDGKQSSLGSEHRLSDTSIHTTELRNELLNLLSQVSERIEKLEIKLEMQGNLIEDEHKQTQVLEKSIKEDKKERLHQDTVIQTEVKTIKDKIKSHMSKTEEEHSKSIIEVKEDIKELERMSINEIKSIRNSVDAFKVLTTKQLEEQRTVLSTDQIKYIEQIYTAVKDAAEQAKNISNELDDSKRSYKIFIASTNKIMKDYETSVSNDLNDFKQEINASVQEVKEQTEMSIDNVTSELLKISQKGKDHKVAFTAYGVAGTTSIIFPHVIQNNGNGYDSSTGKFTCKMPGIYYFAAQLSKEYRRKTDFVECFIYHNYSSKVGARADPNGVRTQPDNDGYSLSMSGTFHLNKHDYVFIGGCTGISAVYTDNRSSFTGFLVTPDY